MDLFAVIAQRATHVAALAVVLTVAVGASVALALHTACVRRDVRARRRPALAPARVRVRLRRRWT